MPVQRKSVVVVSARNSKKYQAINMIREPDAEKWKKVSVVSFGAPGYEDYTSHKDKKRRLNYLKRHGAIYPKSSDWNENYQPTESRTEKWGPAGWNTPGWWSRWLLWNQPTLQGSAGSIKSRFDITVSLKI